MSPAAVLALVPQQRALGLDKDSPELKRVSNINSDALAEFRAHYRDQAITEDDLFYYTYGVLHSPQWRETFANDLRKAHARIPMAASGDDFRAFVAAGRELADLHVNYETVEPYPLEEIHAGRLDCGGSRNDGNDGEGGGMTAAGRRVSRREDELCRAASEPGQVAHHLQCRHHAGRDTGSGARIPARLPLGAGLAD